MSTEGTRLTGGTEIRFKLVMSLLLRVMYTWYYYRTPFSIRPFVRSSVYPLEEWETRAVILLDGSSCRNTGPSCRLTHTRTNAWLFGFQSCRVVISRFSCSFLDSSLVSFFRGLGFVFLIFFFQFDFPSVCVCVCLLGCRFHGMLFIPSAFDRQFPARGCLVGGTGRAWLKENIGADLIGFTFRIVNFRGENRWRSICCCRRSGALNPDRWPSTMRRWISTTDWSTTTFWPTSCTGKKPPQSSHLFSFFSL